MERPRTAAAPFRARAWLRPRGAATALGVAAALTAITGPAWAHVTVQPGTVEGGGFSVVTFRVPTERDDASTTKVRVLLPEDQPVGSVSTTPLPGWKVTTKSRTLEEPIDVFGAEVDSVVAEVTWTATGPGVGPHQFQDFDLSLGPLPESGEMVFGAIQTYSSGDVVEWNEVAVDDSVEPEHPAPVLTVTPPQEEEGTTAAVEAPDEGSGVLPLVLSGAALLVSALALVVAARRRA